MKSTVLSRCQYVVIGCSAICKMFVDGTKPIAAKFETHVEHFICIITTDFDESPSVQVLTTKTLGFKSLACGTCCKLCNMLDINLSEGICACDCSSWVYLLSGGLSRKLGLCSWCHLTSTHCFPRAVHVTNKLHLCYHVLGDSTNLIYFGKSEVRFME